jgi:hypothetical protein
MTDRSARFQHWFQLITNVAILFGLGLVVYELNQSKQLASAQFVIDNYDRPHGAHSGKRHMKLCGRSYASG